MDNKQHILNHFKFLTNFNKIIKILLAEMFLLSSFINNQGFRFLKSLPFLNFNRLMNNSLVKRHNTMMITNKLITNHPSNSSNTNSKTCIITIKITNHLNNNNNKEEINNKSSMQLHSNNSNSNMVIVIHKQMPNSNSKLIINNITQMNKTTMICNQ